MLLRRLNLPTAFANSFMLTCSSIISGASRLHPGGIRRIISSSSSLILLARLRPIIYWVGGRRPSPDYLAVAQCPEELLLLLLLNV
jgi:hypothetical protein